MNSNLSVRDARAVLEALITARLSVRRLGSADWARTFSDLGLDSAAVVELVTVLNEKHGTGISEHDFFEHPTPESLAHRIAGAGADGQSRNEDQETPGFGPAGFVHEDPVVITGISVELPGGITTTDALWQVLSSGKSLIGPWPRDRGWDLSLLDEGSSEASIPDAGGFLTDAAFFEAELFGISRREARAMDPQQRVALRGAFRALVDAGLNPFELAGRSIGVYVGASPTDYGPQMHIRSEEQGRLLTGTAPSVISGRIAYSFGLVGPAITTDTACSSSLSALHMALQAIRSGDCQAALVGGVCVMGTPGMFVEFSSLGGLSKDGHCRSYSDRASGTVWSEGAGFVLIERASEARSAGRRIYGEIRGSALNQDGRSNGLSAPNRRSQVAVVKSAIERSGLRPADIDVIEGHGTGTPLGDPIEISALTEVFSQEEPRHAPVRLGSLKSNAGHAQAAAGILGLVKTVVSAMHRTIPPTIHSRPATTKVQWRGANVELAADMMPWPSREGHRFAGVSAFGISGTNAHVILAFEDEEDGTL